MAKDGLSETALRAMAERVAPAVHDAWAAQRRKEGWQHGPARDDVKRETPLLVTWDALPESEREYDRITAITVLRALDADGWRFTAPSAAGPALRTNPREAAAAALESGEPLTACDMLSSARKVFPDDPELGRLHALALARSGAVAHARAILDALVAAGHSSGEVLGLLARTVKDEALESEGARRRELLQEAKRRYEEAHRASPDPWTAINAATLAVLLGEEKDAKAHATRARELANAAGGDPYWSAATLAEAALVLGDRAAAAERYRDAVRLAGTRWGSIATTRKNARLLGAGADILDALRLPAIASLRGAPADPGNDSRREKIRDELARAGVGFVHVAPIGAEDLLLAEEALARGAELHLVLPCDEEPFLAGGTAERRARVAPLLQRATRVIAASGSRVGGALSDEYACRIASGIAANRAVQLGAEHLQLAREKTAPPASGGAIGIRAFLFSDTLGYSRLTDDEVARYMEHFLGAIGELVRASAAKPLVRNTWGDAIYLAFADVAAAAAFALQLRDRVARADWTVHGLPKEITLRIALHAGPAYETVDAVTGAANIFGAHVSRAARIEPVTPPGEVYTSEAFAALAASESGLVFEYVGQLPLAKGYGTFPTYHMRRRAAQ